MIVLKLKRAIFLKAKKTAGTSFEIALSRHASESDIITPIKNEDELIRRNLGFPGPMNFKEEFSMNVTSPPRLGEGLRNHSTAEECKAFVGEDFWKSAHKLSIVRNPFDRIISHYFWNQKGALNLASRDHFRKWLVRNSHLLSANEEFYFIEGKLALDSAIRYENLIEDSKKAISGLGMDGDQLAQDLRTIHSKSGIRPRDASVGEFFGDWPDGRRIVEDNCRKELEIFGYEYQR